MDITIHPRTLRGDITIIPSKSLAHRILICAAFSDKLTQIRCAETSRDMDATADCLRSLGAGIIRTETGYSVSPEECRISSLSFLSNLFNKKLIFI